MRAQVTRPPKDTIRFEAPAVASRCGRAGLGQLLYGSEGGNGVMIWLRPGDSLATGEVPLLSRADSVATRGATVSARYMLGRAAYGFTLDSGAVWVTRAEPSLDARARGSAPGTIGMGRVALDASFESLPIGPDTVACQARP